MRLLAAAMVLASLGLSLLVGALTLSAIMRLPL